MKLSVSVPDEDVARLDAYVETAGLASRSAGVQHALRMLDRASLEADYAEAWAEWEASGDAEAWERTAADR